MNMGRGISEKFLKDLRSGELRPVLETVLCDDTLCLEIRNDYINIYYRGGNMLRIIEKPSGYKAEFDMKYCEHKTAESKFKQQISEAKTIFNYITIIPFIKAEMDFYFHEHPKLERECQQLILRENNSTSLANDTDYYIADIEYANSQNGSRFDMLAVKWPSTSVARKNSLGLSLSFIEVKYGDNALVGAAGLSKHFADMESFLSADYADGIFTEVETMLNQKIELGLVNGLRESTKISLDRDKKPEFVLLFANHKPASSVLKRELETIINTDIYKRLYSLADTKIAVSNYMGFGLYENGVISLEDFLNEY